ncbi:hypothetical protein ACJRO7_017427 [Eucalyptus globulus]|uniref:Nodule Cysteine-Rich (NCR) secreted peptide n=1 Tax=Eucalyptus globulus TaxID=34317 RepID=A0ABD3KQ53_EUCGL
MAIVGSKTTLAFNLFLVLSLVLITFHLTTSASNLFNQNLDCDNLFIGQWICLNNVTIY